MLRRITRSVVVASAIAAVAATPASASAQSYYFASCASAGVCGSVEAIFAGSILSVQLENADAVLGSALFSAHLVFASALASATPGAALSVNSTVGTTGPVGSIGNTAPGWVFSTVGGSTALDLASFASVFIEGLAASPFRASPGDTDDGTWITGHGGTVDFTADLSSISGVAANSLVGLTFCTDQNCASGSPVLVTPEPATVTLMATGLLGIGVIRRRRNKTA